MYSTRNFENSIYYFRHQRTRSPLMQTKKVPTFGLFNLPNERNFRLLTAPMWVDRCGWELWRDCSSGLRFISQWGVRGSRVTGGHFLACLYIAKANVWKLLFKLLRFTLYIFLVWNVEVIFWLSYRGMRGIKGHYGCFWGGNNDVDLGEK